MIDSEAIIRAEKMKQDAKESAEIAYVKEDVEREPERVKVFKEADDITVTKNRGGMT